MSESTDQTNLWQQGQRQAFGLWASSNSVAAPVLLLTLLLGLSGCGDQSQAGKKLAQETASTQKSENENDLNFDNVILEQANEQGQRVWKVKANQATYNKEQKIALVTNPSGELFQNGKAVYQINAQQGEIHQDGKLLFLKGQIVATDPRTGLVLRGNELEWRPGEDLLIVRNQLRGTHKQVQVKAQEARVTSRYSRVELRGQVVATAPSPSLQMQTEHLIWQVQEQKLIGDRPIQIDRYQDKVRTDRATGNSSLVNLQTKIATLKQNAQINLLDPSLQVNSNEIRWDLSNETINTPQAVRIVDQKQQITATADRGRMELRPKVVYLTGNVNGTGQRRQSIKAQKLTWYLPTQFMEAEGNVFYRQIQPPVSFSGQKAVGKLQEQNIVVSGGRVVTEIVP